MTRDSPGPRVRDVPAVRSREPPSCTALRCDPPGSTLKTGELYMTRHPSNDRRGFSLIELLLIMVVVGILAAIAIARYDNMRERAFRSTMVSDLKNLSPAIKPKMMTLAISTITGTSVGEACKNP